MTSATASQTKTLSCPYPTCEGKLSVADGRHEVYVCPVCQRLSALCRPESGKRPCGTLNRPLARCCRGCGARLGSDWPGDVWDRALIPRDDTRHAGKLTVGAPQIVASLEADAPLGPRFRETTRLVEAGGVLWVLGGDGRFAMADPFADRGGQRRFLWQQSWEDGTHAAPRSRRDGPWLILWSKQGLRAIDLLSVDEAAEYHELSFEVWRSSRTSRLASGPVLLPIAECDDLTRKLHRDLVWLVEDGGGLALATARLPSPGRGVPEMRIEPLRTDDGRALSSAEDLRAAPELVLEASSDAEGTLFLATAGTVFHVERREGAPPRLRPLFARKTGETQITGLSFLPRGADAAGVLFVACREPAGPSLVIVDCESRDSAPIRCPQSATSLGTVRLPGLNGMLCVVENGLAVSDRDGELAPLASSQAFASAREGRVHGRVAVAWGAEILGVKNEWFSLVYDLVTRSHVARLVSRLPASSPLIVGPYLFRIEGLPRHGGDGPDQLCLTRRALELVAGGET